MIILQNLWIFYSLKYETLKTHIHIYTVYPIFKFKVKWKFQIWIFVLSFILIYIKNSNYLDLKLVFQKQSKSINLYLKKNEIL